MTAAAGVVGVVVGGIVEVLVWQCATDVRLGGDGVCAVALAIDVAGGGVSVAGVARRTLGCGKPCLQTLKEIKHRECHRLVEPCPMKGIGNKIVQPGSRGGRRQCQGREDVRARKEVRDESSTQLGC